jgi:tetratricopeptide (TPR) repeat protein
MWTLMLMLLACSTEQAPTTAQPQPAPEQAATTPTVTTEAIGLPRNHTPPRPFHQPEDPALEAVLAATQASDADTALALLAPLLEQKPDSAEVNFFQGRALILRRSFPEAIPYLETAIRADPALAQAHKELAGAYLSIREMDAAEASINTYLSMVDTDAEGHFLLGFCLKHRKYIDGAIAATQQACDMKMEKACRVRAFLADRKADMEAARQAMPTPPMPAAP